LIVITACAPAAAQAPQAPHPGTCHALVVGSNAGGPGQAPLRYAERDALRMAEVLTELGGCDPQRVRRLVAPDGAELLDALDGVGRALAEQAQAGEETRFFFYYSGHARADALNLGDERVPLAELDQRLSALPATLSIAVLDACQSGAFVRSKGAGPATDFSFNSVERLRTRGVAVIASSSSAELSQESDELQAGHFTHHWLVSLRGAGDADADGVVTLSEAYAYAYNRTLASTAATTIGEQHATLRNEITGQGDVALTRPADASAHLILPEDLKGRLLLQRLPSYSVMAEVDKVAGEHVRLALPAGRYQGTLRKDGSAFRCPFELFEGQAHRLDLGACRVARLETAAAKGDAGGGGVAVHPPRERPASRGDEGFFLELNMGRTTYARDDGFEGRLEDFGFEGKSVSLFDGQLSLGRRLGSHLAVGASLFDLDAARYEREEQFYEYDAGAVAAFVQVDRGWVGRRLINLFVRGSVGYAFGDSVFDAYQVLDQNADADGLEVNLNRREKVEDDLDGIALSATAGASLMPLRNAGFMLSLRYTYAPILENGLGESRNLGGLAVFFGIRLRNWEGP
jgi:hypothetical protein